MPIITMLETKRSPSVGSPAPCARSAPSQSPSRSRATMIWPTISPGGEVAHQPLRAGVAERAGERAADLARDAERAAVGFRDVDALDLVRALAGMLAGQPQQPFARAVDRHLLGHHFRPRQREMRVERRAQLLRHAGHLRRSAWRRAHRASARAAARASCAAPRGTPMRAERVGQLRRATARPATASPAAHSARAAPSRRSPRGASVGAIRGVVSWSGSIDRTSGVRGSPRSSTNGVAGPVSGRLGRALSRDAQRRHCSQLLDPPCKMTSSANLTSSRSISAIAAAGARTLAPEIM